MDKNLEGVVYSERIDKRDLFCVGDLFTVIAGDSLWNTFEFDNYSDALKKFEEVKGKGFCRVELVVSRVLKVEGEE